VPSAKEQIEIVSKKETLCVLALEKLLLPSPASLRGWQGGKYSRR